MNEYFQFLQELLEEYGALIVFPVLLLENFPFVGFVAPAITILIIAGFLLAPTPPSLLLVLLVAYSAIVIGDNTWYFIGRYGSGKLKMLDNVSSRANTVLEVIRNQPKVVMFFYQFPPYFRMFLPFGLGMSRYPFQKWILVNLIGSALYVLVFTGIGYIAYQVFDTIDSALNIGEGITYVITFFALAYLVVLVYRYIKKRRDITKE